MRILNTLAFCGATLLASSSFAATLTASEILGQFNAVVKTTFTTKHDVEGRLVADHITGGATFYLKPGSSVSDFAAVNANVIDSFGGGNVNNSGNVNYQVSNANTFSFNGGSLLHSAPAFAISDFSKPLDALATQLAGKSANSLVNATDTNNFKFNIDSDVVSASGTAVFELKGADTTALFNASSINFVGSANTIIVNVYGTSLAQASGSNFSGDAFLNTHVIWNFVDATSLSFKYWHGTVLAGNAAVTNTSPIEGTLYANSFIGDGELHNFAFAGTLPTPVSAVPEPATWMLLLAGLAGIMLMARRRAGQA